LPTNLQPTIAQPVQAGSPIHRTTQGYRPRQLSLAYAISLDEAQKRTPCTWTQNYPSHNQDSRKPLQLINQSSPRVKRYPSHRMQPG
jgi:hypothetical protein